MNQVTEIETIELNGCSYDVIARERAANVSPLTDGKLVEIATIDKLLLNTGDEIFQCVHPRGGDCRKVFDSVGSVIAHQRVHGATAAAKKLAEVKAKEAAEFTRRSAGQVAVREAKKQRHDAEVTSTDPRVAKIQRGLSDLAVGVVKVTTQLSMLAEDMRSLNAQLGEITLQEIKDAEVDLDKMSTEEKFAFMKKLMS